jgi:hypothetical protein
MPRTSGRIEPIVDALAADPKIMQRLRAAIVSKDEKSGREAIHEVKRRAQALDIAVNGAEGISMLLILGKRIKAL